MTKFDPTDEQHVATVGDLLRNVAATIVMPMYRRLLPGEIDEKSPGELVTTVDRQSEAALSTALAAMDHTARIIGEEACSVNPTLLDEVGSGRLWLIDPLDGTANYAAGREPFGIMVALVEDGETLAGWIYDPVTERLCHAQVGRGAWIDGRRVRVRQTNAERPIAALSTRFMKPKRRETVETAIAAAFDLRPIPGSAAAHYPRLIVGEDSLALFQRILPWDHAAGALFMTEAGGVVRHWDGSPYRVGSSRTGILAATDLEIWERAWTRLFHKRLQSYDASPARPAASP